MNDDDAQSDVSRRARWTLEVILDWFLDHLDKLDSDHAHQIAIWLAARSAAREFPIVWVQQNNSLIVPTLWALSISRVVAAFPFLKNNPLSEAAANATLTPAEHILGSNKMLGKAAFSSFCAAHAISLSHSNFLLENGDFDGHSAFTFAIYAADHVPWVAVSDLRWLEKNDYVISVHPPLWHGEDNKIMADYAALKQKLQQDPDNVWSFFIDDYDRQLAGETPDWHVLKALAHPDAIEVWQSNDPKQLADYIHQIQEARDAGTDSPSKAPDSLIDTLEAIARKTPIGARFRYNPENHLIEEVSLTTSTDEEIDHATYEIGEAQNALRGLNENVRGLFQPVFAGLNQALEPENRKATKLFSAAMACQRQIIKICEVNVLGNPKDDPCIHRALNALEIAIACLHFPEEERPIIDTIIDVAALANALDISNPASDFNMLVDLSTAASEPDLAANIEAYREIIQDPNADEQAKQIAWHYLLGIVSRIGLVALGIPSDALLFTIPEIALFIKSEARRLLWDVLRDLVKESLKDWFRGE